MKKAFLGLMMFSLVSGCVFSSTRADQLIPNSQKTLTTMISDCCTQLFDRLCGNVIDQQTLFKETCQKMGMDAQKIKFHIGNSVDDSYAQNNTVVLGLRDAFLPKREREFVIAHELAHIKNKDNRRQYILAGKASVGSFCLSIGLDIVRSRLLQTKGRAFGEFIPAVLCCAAPFVMLVAQAKRLEKEADLTAIAALKEKQGAIDFFKRFCEENKRISKVNYNQQGFFSMLRFPVDRHGNYLRDFTHPRLTDRIAYCSAAVV